MRLKIAWKTIDEYKYLKWIFDRNIDNEKGLFEEKETVRQRNNQKELIKRW